MVLQVTETQDQDQDQAQDTLAAPTGTGVKVALIDSGVNAQHSHVRHMAGGIQFFLSDEGAVQTSPEYPDHMGHGTALAGVLRAKAPQVELYAVKIFSDHLATSFPVLEAALHWAIEQRIKIINLSLGLINPDHRASLMEIVMRIQEANLVLVAASPPDRSDVLPATLPGVIGVAGDETCAWDEHRYMAESPVIRSSAPRTAKDRYPRVPSKSSEPSMPGRGSTRSSPGNASPRSKKRSSSPKIVFS